MSTQTLAALIEQRLQHLGRRSAAAAFERLKPLFKCLDFRVEETDRTVARDRFSQIVNNTASEGDTPSVTVVRKHRREDEAVVMISLDDLANAVETMSHELEAQIGQSRPLRGLLEGLEPIDDSAVRAEFGTVNLDTDHQHDQLRWDEPDEDAKLQPATKSSLGY